MISLEGQISNIVIYDITGKLVLEHNMGNKTSVDIETVSFDNGVYMVALRINGIIEDSKTLIIQK